MKRTLELVSFVSFVSFVMGIVLMDVTENKRPVDKTVEKHSEKKSFPSNGMAVYKAGLKVYQ